MIKFKKILEKGMPFLYRWSMPFRDGSIKLHVITDDDKGEYHNHPWDFKSLILFGGYKEEQELLCVSDVTSPKDVWSYYGHKRHLVQINNYYPFMINRKSCDQKHKVSLFRIFGFKIPAITIGVYGKKKQLCSLCYELGYCKQNKK